MRREECHRAGEHFICWYIRNGQPWVQRRVDLFADRVGATPTSVNIQELGYRWGSCGKGGHVNIHWRTMCLPPRLIDYVVVHELVHFLEPRHGAAFWRRMERVLPDYEVRKHELAENGGFYR